MNEKFRDKTVLLVMGILMTIVGTVFLTYSVMGYIHGSPSGQPRINRWGTVDWNLGANSGDMAFLNDGAWGLLIIIVGIALFIKSKRRTG